MFGEKKGRFRPAGGEISFWVSNRVTRVNNRSYAVRMHTGRVTRPKATVAGASQPPDGQPRNAGDPSRNACPKHVNMRRATCN